MPSQFSHQLANEYARRIKALFEQHEANLEALYREFQEKAAEQKANANELDNPGTGFSCSQNDQQNNR